tara:strand:- start:10861 stop:11487 length:627 start_codon:yes stop_codon:yes gene_type:complete
MKKLILILIIIFFASISVKLYLDKNKISNINTQNINALNDSIKYHKNKYNKEVASKLALQYNLSQLKDVAKKNEELKEVIKNFKKPITIVKTKQVTKIDTVYIPFDKPIEHDFKRFFDLNDKYYQLNGKVSNLGISIDNITIPNKQNIIVGWKKQGLFKKPLLTTEITNSNPYIKQIEIQPIVITYPKIIYEKWYVVLPVGYILGKAL